MVGISQFQYFKSKSFNIYIYIYIYILIFKLCDIFIFFYGNLTHDIAWVKKLVKFYYESKEKSFFFTNHRYEHGWHI